MSEQVLRNGNAMARSKTRTVTQIAMLGAIAGILMNLEFPLPFLAATFYQLDFSEIPVLVGSFAMGPIAGVLIELVKILVHLVTKGSMTAVVTCFINAFVLLPAYGKAFGMPVEAFIEMGSAVHPSVNSLLGFVALIIVPFNLFKYILISVIVFFIYKRIRVILKGD